MNPPSIFEQLKSIIALPFMVTIMIPIALNYGLSSWLINPFQKFSLFLSLGIGILFLGLGLPLFIQSIILFIRIGRGTLAPWNPTKKLVVKRLYRYTRNPMILGVACILLAEAFLFRSGLIFAWAILFVSINHFYFILSEEPGLHKRFGDEYIEYKQNVPRWIPRLKGWRPEEVNT